MKEAASNREQTTKAVTRFARLQIPGIIAGVIAAVGIAIFGTGPAKLFLIPAVGVIAFLVFYMQAKRAGARGGSRRGPEARSRSRKH